MRVRQLSGRSSRQRRLNDMTSWLLIFVVLASPIPIASNRPIFWMLSAAMISLAASLHLFVLARCRWSLRYHPTRNPILLAGIVIYFGFLVAQVLPVGAVFGAVEFRFPNGVSLRSNTLSLTPGATQLALLRTISYGIFFFLMLEVSRNRDRARRIAWVLFIGTAVHALWALVSLYEFQDSFIWGKKEFYLGVATGTFINRNSFATFLGFGLVLGVSLLSRRDGGPASGGRGLATAIGVDSVKSYVCYGFLLIVFAALLSTQSRMGLFATLVGVSVAISGGWLTRAKSDRLTLAIRGMAIVLVSSGVAALYGRGLLERFVFVENAAGTRSALYLQIMEMIRARPFLGYGMDSFEQVFPLFHKAPVSIDLSWDKAHSTYLTLWSEMGLIAGSIPLFLVGVLFVRLAKDILSLSKDYDLSLAALGVIVLASIHSLVDFSLEIQANVFLFLAVLALGFCRNPNSDSRAPVRPEAA